MIILQNKWICKKYFSYKKAYTNLNLWRKMEWSGRVEAVDQKNGPFNLLCNVHHFCTLHYYYFYFSCFLKNIYHQILIPNCNNTKNKNLFVNILAIPPSHLCFSTPQICANSCGNLYKSYKKYIQFRTDYWWISQCHPHNHCWTCSSWK